MKSIEKYFYTSPEAEEITLETQGVVAISLTQFEPGDGVDPIDWD